MKENTKLVYNLTYLWQMYQNQTETTKEYIRLTGYVIAIFLFFLLAVVFYANYEQWSINDSVYFVIVTISTVGYGTPHPSDDNSRLFTLFFILIGVFVIIVGANEVLHSKLKLVRDFLCKSRKLQVAEDLEVGDLYRYRRQLLYLLLAVSICIVVGAVVMKCNEDWTWTEAFYFIIETSATVGYGDLNIVHASSKTFLCFYIIVCTFLIATTIRTLTAVNVEIKQIKKLEQSLQQILSLDFLVDEVSAEKPKLSRHEIVIQTLVHMGVLDMKKDILPLLKRLSLGDGDGLDKNEVQNFVHRERELAIVKLQGLEEAKRQTKPKLLLHAVYESFGVGRAGPSRGSFNTMELSSVALPGGSTSSGGLVGRRPGAKDDTQSPLQNGHDDDV